MWLFHSHVEKCGGGGGGGLTRVVAVTPISCAVVCIQAPSMLTVFICVVDDFLVCSVFVVTVGGYEEPH